MHELVEKLLKKDALALSRLMTLVENRSNGVFDVMREVQQYCGKAHCLGVTGPPGAGKSTLVDKLIHHFRKAGKGVGVVAIDPSSPFSGGAVMGDRIRMQDHAQDNDVFIRSLGTRGSHGGLSRATREMVKLLDAYGVDEVLVETVGVGQTELNIMGLADTTVVVLTPESGDTIQTMKAGILEIADVFVVNKADRAGANQIYQELKVMVEIGASNKSGWTIPVLMTQAKDDQGVAELIETIDKHRSFIEERGLRADRRQKMLIEEAKEIVMEEVGKRIGDEEMQGGAAGELNPYESAQRILEKMRF